MQYMRDMLQGLAVKDVNDNNRYSGIKWTDIKSFLISENVKEKYQ
jgi:hypothetical protein